MNTAKKPRYHSIQAKITYPVVGLFIFFIVAIYFLATYIYNRTITRQSETTIKAMSQQVISNYDTYFESVIKVSDAIQAKIDYLDLSTSKKEVSSYLDEIMSIQSPIYNISIYSATGGFVVGNTDYTDPPIDASGEAWFTKALNNQLVNNFSPVSVYSSEDPLFTVSKHVYYNQEKNEGVMKMEYSFSKIVSLIARTDLGDGGNILITDKDDNLVYASVSPVPEAEKKLADSLVFGMSSYTNSGSSYLLYVSTIQNTTWSAAIATNHPPAAHFASAGDGAGRMKRMSELKALQNQINPHFLYNTMDSIIYLIDKGDNPKAEEMIMALSKFFRISISRGKNVIPLTSEIEHAKNYLIIQKIRYGDSFDYEIKTEPGIEKYFIIKLVLQPIIENAIMHGIEENSGRTAHITISEEVRDGLIRLEVKDDGYGILPERLQEIYASFHDDAAHNGVGLKNVYQRLKIYYGEKADIIIDSVLDQGTKVTLVIPEEGALHDEE
jgi:hypothetical protein